MTFKEFKKWSIDKQSQGCLSILDTIIICQCMEVVSSKPFWKREKHWHEFYEKCIVTLIVEPTNQKIDIIQKIDDIRKEY